MLCVTTVMMMMIMCLPGQFVWSVDNSASKNLQILISGVDFSGLLFING